MGQAVWEWRSRLPLARRGLRVCGRGLGGGLDYAEVPAASADDSSRHPRSARRVNRVTPNTAKPATTASATSSSPRIELPARERTHRIALADATASPAGRLNQPFGTLSFRLKTSSAARVIAETRILP